MKILVFLPKAQDVFNEDGSLQTDEDQITWFDYFSRTFNRLIWWGEATKEHRSLVDPHNMIKDFKATPSGRNAP
ncbi:hypothetical protein [Pseudoalteromonas sp. TB64]|uniref:hypothetical protein n=1 Tax=Pseudoalteromonas sp. TB64 TaxID=1938600 RepID=UPI00111147C8|nr:hypothetical protein [Pseudoalteromonas sp. TB64]